MRQIVRGVYRHFKGGIYEVKGFGLSAETQEKCVIYQSLNDKQIWVRSLEEFASEVDKIKYPNISQKYRFEKLG